MENILTKANEKYKADLYYWEVNSLVLTEDRYECLNPRNAERITQKDARQIFIGLNATDYLGYSMRSGLELLGYKLQNLGLEITPANMARIGSMLRYK